MKESFKKQLFAKHILVNDTQKCPENIFEALFSLANILNIKITKGQQLASLDVFKFASSQLGENVPQPFYLGFPESVRNLTPEQLLFDQLVHYTVTYGFGDFSQPGHSLFQENFERVAFKENTIVKEFVILNEEDAKKELEQIFDNLLLSSRPLNDTQYTLVKDFLVEYDFEIKERKCKDTLIRLILDTKNFSLARLLHLSDFIRVVEYVNHQNYKKYNIKKLNFKNQDRKILSKILDILLDGKFSIMDCYEKQATWCGILHHIHYKPKTDVATNFVNKMRSGENASAYSYFEKAMNNNDIKKAIDSLVKYKGESSLMRKLNYVLSRCEKNEDIDYLFKVLETNNNLVIIQNMLQYHNYKSASARIFRFTRFNKLKSHIETEEERARRKSVVTRGLCNRICEVLRNNLAKNLKGKLGKVYIDDDMENIALPIQENTSMGGYGTLPKGSRLNIEDGKKIRAFIYWEKVNDIDLSCIALTEKLKNKEYSWRTMASNQSKMITFSGDITSGFNGASEYFDIDIEKCAKSNPQYRYLIFCANVYSATPFKDCICKAGFMKRDVEDSGEIFEPKTVETSFQINCDSTFAYMFAIDVLERKMIWLNMAKDSNAIVAGTTSMELLMDYFSICDVINMKMFFTMLASEVVTNIEDADVVVSDKTFQLKEGVEVLHSYDTDKILALLNEK